MIALLNHMAESWWTWMADMFWQAGLLILLVGLIDFFIRKWAWPQVRYALWLLVLVKLVIPPTWTLPSGVIPRIAPAAQERIAQRVAAPFQSSTRQSPTVTDPARSGLEEDAGAAAGSAGTTAAESSVASASRPVWQLYAMVVWIAGMALFVAMLSLRVKKLRRWHLEQRDGKTIPPWFHELMVQTAQRLGLRRLPAIVFSDEVVTPAVYGVFRPVMLLPANYEDSLTPEQAEHVLLHELAHLKRGDLVVHGIGMLLHIVYWFNPLMIWVGRQIKHVREMCCDLTIADVLREKTARYRQTLLDTARALLTESVEPGMGFLGVFEEPYRLVARLKWLEKETWRNRSKVVAAVMGVVVVMVPFVLPMAADNRDAEGDRAAYAELSSHSGESAADAEPASDDPRQKFTCITEIGRTIEKRFWRTTSSRIDYVGEMWLGDGIAALHERDRTIICDLNNDYFCFVNHHDSTYVETSLPVTRADVLEAKVRWDFLENPWTGSVSRISKAMDVLALRCDGYQIEAYREIDGSVVAEQRYKVWSTTKVPFDLSAYHTLLENRRVLQPRDENFQDELRSIAGLQMYLEFKESKLFFKRVVSTEVVEIAERYPDEYTYSVPPGYREKKYLRRHDL